MIADRGIFDHLLDLGRKSCETIGPRGTAKGLMTAAPKLEIIAGKIHVVCYGVVCYGVLDR
jgi:hypothetical protein